MIILGAADDVVDVSKPFFHLFQMQSLDADHCLFNFFCLFLGFFLGSSQKVKE